MKHITEDKLLEYALETCSGDAEKAEIESHLDSCLECREQQSAIHKDIDLLGGVKGRKMVVNKPIAVRTRFSVQTMLKAAALLIFGFLSGLGVSNLVQREPISIMPSYIELSPPADSLTSFVATDATQIDRDYYEQILADQ